MEQHLLKLKDLEEMLLVLNYLKSFGSNKKNIAKETNSNKIKLEFVNGDSASVDLQKVISDLDIKSVQFQIFHPPYWDIIKFSENKSDLSNAKSIDDF